LLLSFENEEVPIKFVAATRAITLSP